IGPEHRRCSQNLSRLGGRHGDPEHRRGSKKILERCMTSKSISSWAIAAVMARGAATSAGAATCESLLSFKLPNTIVPSAQVTTPGPFTIPQGGAPVNVPDPSVLANLPSFCRVAATLTPTSDSDIKVEVGLPVSGWNRKLQSVGNGAWAGSLPYPALATAVAG